MSDLDNEIKETSGHKTTVEISQKVFNLINGLRGEKQLIAFCGSDGITLWGSIGRVDDRDIDGNPTGGPIIGYRLYISPEGDILMETYAEPNRYNSGATEDERKSIYSLELEESGGKYTISATPTILGKCSEGIEEGCKPLARLDGDLIQYEVIYDLRRRFDNIVVDIGRQICNRTSVGVHYQEISDIYEKLVVSGYSPFGTPEFNDWMSQLRKVLDKSRWDSAVSETNNNLPQTTKEFKTAIGRAMPVSVILKDELQQMSNEVINFHMEFVKEHLTFIMGYGDRIASELARAWNLEWGNN